MLCKYSFGWFVFGTKAQEVVVPGFFAEAGCSLTPQVQGWQCATLGVAAKSVTKINQLRTMGGLILKAFFWKGEIYITNN